jgi:hypothetical protein
MTALREVIALQTLAAAMTRAGSDLDRDTWLLESPAALSQTGERTPIRAHTLDIRQTLTRASGPARTRRTPDTRLLVIRAMGSGTNRVATPPLGRRFSAIGLQTQPSIGSICAHPMADAGV